MESLNLSLFTTLEPELKVNTVSEPITIPKEPINTNPLASLENTLNSLLPQQVEDTNVIRTRKMLGEVALNLSDEQIEYIVAEFQFLINSWMDEFEKDVFNGMTLKEVLNEG